MSSARSVGLLGGFVGVKGPGWLPRSLSQLYPPGAVAAEGERVLQSQFEVRADPAARLLELVRDGQLVWRGGQRADLLATLVWSIDNALADAGRERYLMLHAAVAARHGLALLLPAPSGSGKSTLVAGLISAGFDYLSDEVAAINPSAGTLSPFARSVALKAGGRAALRAAFPSAELRASGRRFERERVWFLRPPTETIPPEPLRARWVVLPRYVSRQPSRLRPIPRSEALSLFLRQSFNVGDYGGAGVSRLVDLLRGADCLSLEGGDLLGAIGLLRQLTDGAATAPC